MRRFSFLSPDSVSRNRTASVSNRSVYAFLRSRPLNSGLVIRGNQLDGGEGVSIGGSSSDILVEDTVVSHGEGSFKNTAVIVNKTYASGIYLNNNTVHV